MRLLLVLIIALGVNLFAWAGQSPPRVISLAASLSKSMFYLDAADLLVGRTSYCNIEGGGQIEVVASAVSVNIEKLITLQPDLVITTAMTNVETIAMIRRAGIKVEVFQTPRSFDEICSQFIALATLIGREAKAKEVVKEVRTKVEAISISQSYNAPPVFFFQIGANPLFTVLENTFMNDYITFSGGVNIAAGFARGTINREYILVKNPDVIIIVNMGITGDEEKKIWERYRQLNAVKNNRIFFIESAMASTPNPPDFLKTMEAIRENLPPGWWKN
jgi:ABC-type Fe3+-hydroxamate transport system substrate-binding protein